MFEEPIVPDPAVDTRQDLNRMMSRYVERLEHHVRENAACWQHWFEQDLFARITSLPGGTLAERYEIGPQAGAAPSGG